MYKNINTKEKWLSDSHKMCYEPQGWVSTNHNVNCSIVNDTRALFSKSHRQFYDRYWRQYKIVLLHIYASVNDFVCDHPTIRWNVPLKVKKFERQFWFWRIGFIGFWQYFELSQYFELIQKILSRKYLAEKYGWVSSKTECHQFHFQLE